MNRAARLRSLLWLVSLQALASCSGSSASAGGQTGDEGDHPGGNAGAAGITGSGNAGAAGSAGGGACASFARPVLDKHCATASDCFAGVHRRNCCGSLEVLGFNLSAEATFDAYEARCAAQAACDCLPVTPVLENGASTSDLNARFPRCIASQCVGAGAVL